MNGMPADPAGHGAADAPLVVVPYDPGWPAAFEALRERLAPVAGDLAVGIEHVGSTAVPGLAAKPILDVDIVMRHDDDLADLTARLASLGYEPLGDLGVVGRNAFRATAAGVPPHHLYACAAGCAPLRAHLALRDALRGDPRLVAEYASLKKDLARRFPRDRDAYVEGKTAFITRVLLDLRDDERRSHRR